MALAIGNNAMKGAYLGTNQVRRAYKGGTLVYQGFGPATEQEFISKTAQHSGPAQLLKVYGKTIVNNQVIDPAKIPSTKVVKGITMTKDGDTIFASGTTTESWWANYNISFEPTIGHKYLLYCFPNGGLGRGVYAHPQSIGGTNPDDYGDGTVFTISGNTTYIAINFNGSESNPITVDNFIICPRLFDLTLRFGAGNEPTSVDEALRLLGGDAYNPTYDPGSLQSNKTSLLRAYGGGTLRGSLALNLSTLTGKLNGEGASVVVYPDGLRGVGTDRDAASGSTAVQRLGRVDLGTLNWGKSTAGPYNYPVFFTTGLQTSIPAGTMSILCAKYTTRENLNPSGLTEGITTFGHVVQGNIIIYDNSISSLSSADFKAAMSGVMLDYPLATPLTYTLDTPLPTNLICEQGDILQRVSDNNCPFVGEMRFGL